MFVYQVADVKAFPKKSFVSLEDQFRFAVVFAAAELFIFLGGAFFLDLTTPVSSRSSRSGGNVSAVSQRVIGGSPP